MSLSGKPAGAPASAQTQVVADSGASSGQVQDQRSERDPTESALRKKNQEAKGLRNELHSTRAELERIKAEAANKEAEAAAKRGEFESLYHSLKSQYDNLYRAHADTILEYAVQKRIGTKRVKQEAIADVLRLLPKEGLRLKDDDVEGLDDALEEFLSKRPWLLEESGDAPAETEAAAGDPEGIWAEARQQGYQPSGHRGYRPSSQGSGRMVITDEMIEEAERRGMPVEDWREVLEYREAARLAREGK